MAFSLTDLTDADLPQFPGQYVVKGGGVPARAYLHKSGFNLLGSDVEKHIRDVFSSVDLFEDLTSSDWVLGILWADDNKKMTDLIAYTLCDRENWRGNAEPNQWISENGILRKNNGPISCEDGIILLGQEALYRRATSKEDYICGFPNMNGFMVERRRIVEI